VPGAPKLSSGSNPNNTGEFTLSWAASEPATALTYTLQHKSADSGWSNVATGLTSPEYTFTGGSPEGEGTWTYRVTASNESPEGEPSAASEEIKVDETDPNAPILTADRLPDYAGNGGWYKDSVEVSFAENGDPALADTSPGSGVNPESVPSPQVFNTSGVHEASGTVTDNAGNQSALGSLTVQVDATPPSIEVSCPGPVSIGETGVFAMVTASDEQSGLASPPTEMVPINTSTAGVKNVTRTAVDNVGHETTGMCSVLVGYTQVITGNVKGKLVVKKGQAIELTSTAKTSGPVTVKPGGVLDIEGATLSGTLTSKGAGLIRICGASLSAPVNISGSTGSVVVGEGTPECSSSMFHGNVTIKSNAGGVLVEENTFHASLKVTGNQNGTTVTNNTVAGGLTVTGNSGTVTDKPNEVEGKSKLQP
jgi:hypothetical protein